MRQLVHAQPTIGFLSTWAVYEGATIDHYTHSLLQGMYAAARERACNLLLGCGVSLPDSPRASRTAWAVEGAGADFVPVSPENCDGLIIIPDDFSPTQFAYVQELIRSGFPVIFTTNEEPGPLVAVDNAGGIHQALQHLLQHGHRRIAYVAGKAGRGGDSGERLAAYRRGLAEAGIEADERVIAFGEHRRQDGRRAMQQILDGGAAFTALLASNDLSCLGALDALRVTGRRVPEDVAVIGFDDILEARSYLPALTTVRIPTFTLGHTAVTTLLDVIQGSSDAAVALRVPTQFVIRQSCGCHPASQPLNWINQAQRSRAGHPAHSNGDNHDLETAQENLAGAIGDAVFVETRHSLRAEIDAQCLQLVAAFGESIARNDTAPMDAALQALFDWLERQGEEAHPWQSAISTLRSGLAPLMACLARANSAFADALLDQARLQISEQGQRQANSALLQHIELSNRLGLMTAQLLAAPDATASANILAEHLPLLGIEHALVAAYKSADASGEHAKASHYVIRLSVGWEHQVGQAFPAGAFPPPDDSPTAAPLQLALLPLTVDADTHGFVAFSATNLEPLAAITHNLASALRTAHLYHAALEGRRLAEDANRLKSRFLSTVSHELRTPLALIVGLSDMVLQDPSARAAALPSPLRHDLKQIQASARHLGRLINDVLDLASSDAGQLRLLCQPLDLVGVLKESASVGAELAREKGLKWHAEIPAKLPHVVGDRTRLRQVILNLISNAVKFTPAGTVELNAAVDGAQICVQVSDTGIGIPAAEQGKIFDEFHRTEHTMQAGYGGLGLGLAICKELVTQHGGTLGVHSPGNLGQGTTLFFTLPIQVTGNARSGAAAAAKKRRGVTAQDAAQGDAPSRPPVPQALTTDLARAELEPRPRIVLVVDDDPNILALHCRLIEQAGHRAVPAHNGREAIALIQRERPDLVVLDLMMPEMDGFQVVETLHADESLRDLPVIVLSARHLDENDIAHLNHGVTAIMGKGLFSAGETLEHIQAALERQRGLGSPTRQLVRRAMVFIDANYAEPLTREQIAGHISIHPDYLTDCFRQEVGITPMAYLNRARVRQARELLENSDLQITAIAQAVGLGESAHFTRIFQREVGMTPRAYRKSKGNG